MHGIYDTRLPNLTHGVRRSITITNYIPTAKLTHATRGKAVTLKHFSPCSNWLLTTHHFRDKGVGGMGGHTAGGADPNRPKQKPDCHGRGISYMIPRSSTCFAQTTRINVKPTNQSFPKAETQSTSTTREKKDEKINNNRPER